MALTAWVVHFCGDWVDPFCISLEKAHCNRTFDFRVALNYLSNAGATDLSWRSESEDEVESVHSASQVAVLVSRIFVIGKRKKLDRYRSSLINRHLFLAYASAVMIPYCFS